MMKLSVIVPVYNVEKYLPRCLDSLLRQGMKPNEWEVICVNDASSDKCGIILAEYEAKHPDVFKVITQENLGLGEARNAGLAKAQGEWIGFVDPDDYVIDNAYRYILEHYCEPGVDVIHYDYRNIFTNGISLQDSDAIPDGNIVFDGNGTEAFNQQRLSFVWTKFYSRHFLEEHCLRFESPFVEDDLFNFNVFLQHPRLRIVTSNVYRYERGNLNSLVMTDNKPKVKEQLKWLQFMVGKMNQYRKEGDGEMDLAAWRNIDTFGKHYYNKMLRAHFTWSEWRQYSQPIKSQCIHNLDASQESSFLGKMLVCLKKGSATFYVVYLITAFLRNVVFIKWIRPRIISSAL